MRLHGLNAHSVAGSSLTREAPQSIVILKNHSMTLQGHCEHQKGVVNLIQTPDTEFVFHNNLYETF